MESECESNRLAHSLDSCKSLPNRSYPFWRIVCGTTEIGPVENLFLAPQKHHDGNTRESFPEMRDQIASCLPGSSVSDHDKAHGTI